MSFPSPTRKRPASAVSAVSVNGDGDDDDDDYRDPHHRRVVLLLDMDCFYAQCETVRLGLDPTIPLALVQWRSALAVNYPAREFGIKRGDSYDVIQEKSKGKCVAIHLPVTPLEEKAPSPIPVTKTGGGGKSPRTSKNGDVEDGGASADANASEASPHHKSHEQSASANASDDNAIEDDGDPSQSAYDEEFNQPKEVRDEMYRMEKNRMRSQTEGKACLDRYRLASSRIFSLIDETLAKNLGRKNFILERASIDELFIDVTAFCYGGTKESKDKGTETAMRFRMDSQANAIQSLKETVIRHEGSVHASVMNDEVGVALRLGCHVALTTRRAVYDTLGFTLSAGISTSKMVSKLAATFGKPNGQALIHPSAWPKVMEETQISKTRLLGGKLGKRVQSLLPDNETTLGSISRLLSLGQLVDAVGEESGRWVFDACRGIDSEVVRATLKVLPKSITAFKSLPKVSYPELEKWTMLLAREIMRRVDADNEKNHRLPKAITVGYTMNYTGPWVGKTFKLAFPTGDFDTRVQKVVDNTRKALTERGHSSFIRIGFSATDFVVRAKMGIDSFFSKGGKTTTTATKALSSKGNEKKLARTNPPMGISSFFPTVKKQMPSPKPSIDATAGNVELCKNAPLTKRNHEKVTAASNPKTEGVDNAKNADFLEPTHQSLADEKIARQLQEAYSAEAKHRDEQHQAAADRDKAFALQLQSQFDRESSVLTHIDRFSGKRKNNSQMTKSPKSKGNKTSKNTMDYFLKK